MHRHPRSALILVLLALVASALVSPAPAAQAAGGGGLLESWGFPARLLDTRTGSRYGRLGPNETIVVRAGAPDGLCAVNVTAVNPTAAGYLSVVATSDIALQDKVSTLNFTPGVTVANATTVRVVDGSIAVHNGSGGTVDVIVDGLAHYTAGDPTDPGALALVTPQRLIDVRLGGNAALDVAIPGGAGAASAALLNITVDAPSGAGYVKAWPSQGLEPTVSNVNFRPGQTVANAAIVKVGADGKIKLRNGSPAPLRLIVDLGGTVVAGLPTAAGAFLPIVPERLVDSRIGQQLAAPLHAGADAYLEIAGHGAVPSDARAVALNMTAVTPEGAGYLAVAGGDPYVGLMASNANYVAGQDVAALVTADLVDRLVRVHSYAGAELVADAVGYYLGGGRHQPGAAAWASAGQNYKLPRQLMGLVSTNTPQYGSDLVVRVTVYDGASKALITQLDRTVHANLPWETIPFLVDLPMVQNTNSLLVHANVVSMTHPTQTGDPRLVVTELGSRTSTYVNVLRWSQPWYTVQVTNRTNTAVQGRVARFCERPGPNGIPSTVNYGEAPFTVGPGGTVQVVIPMIDDEQLPQGACYYETFG